MYAEESLMDILFLMLYGGAGMAALAGALYLWLRRRSALAPDVESPRELRLWAAAFLFAITASHVWWLLVNESWLAGERTVREVLMMTLDHVTLVPLAVAVLLHMLQDRRRRLWPWLAAQVPIVAMGMAGIATGDARSMLWMIGWQTVVIAAFIVRYFLALREYNGWLLDNFADLEHKDIWRSLAVAVLAGMFFRFYSTNEGVMPVEYLTQWFTIAVVAFLVWRVETTQRLTVEDEDEMTRIQGDTEVPTTVATEVPTTEEVAAEAVESADGKLSAGAVKALGQRLRKECEVGKLYQHPDLRIEQLARTVESNRTYLSAYFVQRGTTYNDYINELRIRHFEQLYRRALQKGGESPKAKDLATESGFSSYSTFGAAFKRLRGMTVTQWMQQLREELK